MGGWGGKIIIIIRIVSVKKGWEVEKKNSSSSSRKQNNYCEL